MQGSLSGALPQNGSAPQGVSRPDRGPVAPRVLIVAENALSSGGGEAILPLHYFRLLRRRGIEAWLLVHERSGDELHASLGPEDRARIGFVPDLPLHKRLNALYYRVPKPLYALFGAPTMSVTTQWLLRRMACRMVAAHGINLVHQPTPVSPKAVSMMFGLGTPVIMGPMNGGMTFPPAMNWLEPRGQRAMTWAARAASHLVNALIPGKLRADVLLVANQRTARALPLGARGRVIELVENGVNLTLFRRPPEVQGPRAGGESRFAFLGRLVDWKGVDLAIEALARVNGPVCLHVIGDGPMREILTRHAARHGVAGHVVFHGFVPQSRCPELLAGMDALVLPSLFECGGAVVLEAMSMGLPVIATKWGGPADYLDETCGVLIEPCGREPFIAALAGAMERLSASAELRQRLGAAGRRRAEDLFDWERKIDAIVNLYGGVLDAGRPALQP